MTSNEAKFANLIVNYDKKLVECREYIKENFGVESTFDEETQQLNLFTRNVNEGLQLMNAKTGELVTGVEELSTKSQTLIAGVNQIKAGANTLNSGVAKLNASTNTLSSASTQLSESSKTIANGMETLSSGINEFNTQAIDKIYNFVDNNVKDLTERIEELDDLSKKYINFAMKDEAMNGNVKFITITDSIKKEKN